MLLTNNNENELELTPVPEIQRLVSTEWTKGKYTVYTYKIIEQRRTS